jgi:hypothetical protein
LFVEETYRVDRARSGEPVTLGEEDARQTFQTADIALRQPVACDHASIVATRGEASARP